MTAETSGMVVSTLSIAGMRHRSHTLIRSHDHNRALVGVDPEEFIGVPVSFVVALVVVVYLVEIWSGQTGNSLNLEHGCAYL